MNQLEEKGGNKKFIANSIVQYIAEFEPSIVLLKHFYINKKHHELLLPELKKRLNKEWTSIILRCEKILILPYDQFPTEFKPQILYLGLLNSTADTFNIVVNGVALDFSKRIIKEISIKKDFFKQNLDEADFDKLLSGIFNPIEINDRKLLKIIAGSCQFLLNQHLEWSKIPEKLTNAILVLKTNSALACDLLKRIIYERKFVLLHFLCRNGVNINSTRVEHKTETYESLRGRDGDEVTKTRHYSITHTVLDSLDGFDFEELFLFSQLKARFSRHQWHYQIIPNIIQALKDQSKEMNTHAVFGLLEVAIRLEEVDVLIFAEDFLRRNFETENPFVVFVEAFYLIHKLEEITPYSLNFLADKRDVPTIKNAIKELAPLLQNLSPLNKDILTNIKFKLLKSAHVNPPGRLITLIQELQKKFNFKFALTEPNYLQNLKQKFQITDFRWNNPGEMVFSVLGEDSAKAIVDFFKQHHSDFNVRCEQTLESSNGIKGFRITVITQKATEQSVSLSK